MQPVAWGAHLSPINAGSKAFSAAGVVTAERWAAGQRWFPYGAQRITLRTENLQTVGHPNQN